MDRRQVYSVSLKLLTLLGVVIIMAVMINSLFPVSDENAHAEASSNGTQPPLLKVSVESLLSGKMKFVSWAGRSVAIVKRIDPPNNFQPGQPLNNQWRSVKAEYFVFYNSVGVSQCPLYLMPVGDRLKDTCSGVFYDIKGERISGNGVSLQIPPYYFESDTTLVVGQWGGNDVDNDNGDAQDSVRGK
ncbi:MAG: hypothetical protein V3U84_08505 [Thiotrichaceae bacterium]